MDWLPLLTKILVSNYGLATIFDKVFDACVWTGCRQKLLHIWDICKDGCPCACSCDPWGLEQWWRFSHTENIPAEPHRPNADSFCADTTSEKSQRSHRKSGRGTHRHHGSYSCVSVDPCCSETPRHTWCRPPCLLAVTELDKMTEWETRRRAAAGRYRQTCELSADLDEWKSDGKVDTEDHWSWSLQ